MNLATAKKKMASIGILLSKKNGEYRVKVNGTNQEYFTSDIEDAMQTGRKMSEEAIKEFKSNQKAN